MNWTAIKALNEIFESGRTKKRESLMKDATFLFLLEQTGELKEGVTHIHQGPDFEEYYRKYHLYNYTLYIDFLKQEELLKPQLRFHESDIRILIELSEGMTTGDLLPIRNGIIEAEETVRGVSQMFFKNEKYLENSDSLIRAVKKILNIEELANDKDQQYKYVLQCPYPEKIVLCENLDFLKRPSKPRKNNIELWYAGGKNIDKLNYTAPITLPIYYSCDWDYDGLLIYQLVKDIIPQILLLPPTGLPKSIVETDHDSHWKVSVQNGLSDLNEKYYTDSEMEIIRQLILKDQWIMEETNDLIKMLEMVKI